MTTVAWDGEFMVADSLSTDYWGLKEVVDNKVIVGDGCLIGMAGDLGSVLRWWRSVQGLCNGAPTAGDILEIGYLDYAKDTNEPQLLLASREGCWRHVGGVFVPVSYPYFAIGSGRDYALAVMSLGHNAVKAVEVAANFDNNTGGAIKKWALPEQSAISFVRPMSDVVFNAPDALQ
jgi:hypothetical protein